MASSLSLSNLSHTSSPNVDRTSPQNQSISFSISAILSDEVGQKKSPTGSSPFATPNANQASTNQQGLQLTTPKRPQSRENLNMSHRKSHISLSDAANMFSSYETSTVQDHPAHPVASFKTSPVVPAHPSLPHGSNLALSTPSRHHSSNPPPSTPSLTLSPFNPTLLHTLSQPAATPTSNKDDMLNDSLGMLSTVAMYHGELSSMNTTIGTPVQERLANMRLASSSSDLSDKSNPECSGLTGGSSELASTSVNKSSRKMATPRILKRDKKKRRQSQTSHSESDKGNFSSGDESSVQHTHLNTGFLSPLAKDDTNFSLQQATFSPSIFLSRPDHTPSPSHSQSVTSDHNESSILPTISVLGASPVSDEEGVAGGGTSTTRSNFVTSTPIKGNKENFLKEKWSPTILKKAGSRRHLKDTNDTSSGSDSDVPVKRPKKMIVPSSQHHHRQKRSKARTKLSPLLENACSPIAKTDNYQPSPLVTTQLTTTPTRAAANYSGENVRRDPSHSNVSAPATQQHQDASHRHTTQPHTYTAQPLTASPPHSFQLSQHMYPPLQPPLMMPRPQIQPVATTYPFIPQTYNCFLPTQMPGAIQSPYIPGFTSTLGISPFFGLSQPFYPNLVSPNLTMANPSLLMGQGRTAGSPSTKIQSVPPWFIFANNKSEGKRSRLTEAINKSLSETPAQKPRLPAEWTKLACGQTNDQKMLTESARNFLQCQPRQLTFAANEDDDSN